jgi:hypothetical protein
VLVFKKTIFGYRSDITSFVYSITSLKTLFCGKVVHTNVTVINYKKITFKNLQKNMNNACC